MKDFEKLQMLYVQIDELITNKVTSDSVEFVTWETCVRRTLKKLYGAESDEVERFIDISFTPMFYGANSLDFIEVCKNGLLESKGILAAFLEDSDDDLGVDITPTNNDLRNSYIKNSGKIFIVHGHDGELKEAVARLVEKQCLRPIILNEQANQGKTIIEKFESNSDVGAAIMLFTADDLGRACSGGEEHPRARQNVVFEAGYFMSMLGRDRTIMLAAPGVEIPSDLQGVVYTDTKAWKFGVLQELKAMGYSIDYNKLDE